MRKLILSALILCTSLMTLAEIEFDGFLDMERSVKLKDDYDYQTAKNRARLNLKDDYDDYSLFLSLNAVNDEINESDDITLHEAYLDYYGDNWELRIGRQINSWGKADGIRITDLINPVDYSGFIIRDFDDLRISTDMIRLKKIGDISDIEIIWIPEFTSNIAPSGKWQTSSFEAGIESPEKNLKNSEIGARGSFYLSGLDFSIAAFYTWNDSPVIKKSGDNYIGEFKRDKFIGADIAKPIGAFVIRAEGAYHPDRYFSSENYSGDYISKNLAKLLIGLDWNPGNSLMITGQISNEIVLDYDENIAQDESTALFTLNISKKYLNETLEISNFTYLELNKDSLYNKFEIIRNINDSLELTGGIDLFAGTEGTFGVYEDNTQFRVKGKYSF